MGRKFTKLNRRFPLTRFRAHLVEQGHQYPDGYVSAIRQLLGGTAEAKADGTTELHWTDQGRVVEYAEKLPRARQVLLSTAWMHWLEFNAEYLYENEIQLQRLGRAPDTNRGPLAEAVRRLTDPFTLAGSKYKVIDVLRCWWKREGADGPWLVFTADDEQLWKEPKWQPLLTAVRNWAYPDGDCQSGDLFLPDAPGSGEPMLKQVLYRLLQRHDTVAAADFDNAMRMASFTANLKTMSETARARVTREGLDP